MPTEDPHVNQPVYHRGADVASARLSAVLVHGRGGSADDLLALASALALPDVAFFAPEAAGRSWYPYSFLAPIDRNEPGLSSALALVGRVVARIEAAGTPSDRIVLLGFSQGACLSLEYAARHARRYAAVIGLSGGLIGPAETPRDYPGSLAGTAVFLGYSDVDPHIPVERVRESAAVLRRMGGSVDDRIYPGMGHTVNDDEMAAVTALLMGHGA